MPIIGERFVNDRGDIYIRILNVYKEAVKIKSEDTNNTSVVPLSYLKDFFLLKPSGYITFSTLNFGKNNYGLFVFFKYKYSYRFAGSRRSRDLLCSCVENNSYSICMDPTRINILKSLYDKYKPHTTIAMYLDDRPEDIYNLLNRKMIYFDQLVKDFVLYRRRKGIVMGNESIIDLRSYLKQMGFWRNIDALMEISHCKLHDPLLVNKDEGIYRISNSDIHSICMNISHNITNIFCAKFDYDIDFSRITRDYMLIRDTKKDLYILAYNKNGLYAPCIERAGLNEDDFAFMLSRISS